MHNVIRDKLALGRECVYQTGDAIAKGFEKLLMVVVKNVAVESRVNCVKNLGLHMLIISRSIFNRDVYGKNSTKALKSENANRMGCWIRDKLEGEVSGDGRARLAW